MPSFIWSLRLVQVLITDLGSSDTEKQLSQAVQITDQVGGAVAAAVVGIMGLITGAGVAIGSVSKVTSEIEGALKTLISSRGGLAPED